MGEDFQKWIIGSGERGEGLYPHLNVDIKPHPLWALGATSVRCFIPPLGRHFGRLETPHHGLFALSHSGHSTPAFSIVGVLPKHSLWWAFYPSIPYSGCLTQAYSMVGVLPQNSLWQAYDTSILYIGHLRQQSYSGRFTPAFTIAGVFYPNNPNSVCFTQNFSIVGVFPSILYSGRFFRSNLCRRRFTQVFYHSGRFPRHSLQ